MSDTDVQAPTLTRATVDKAFLTGPGEVLIDKTLLAFSKLPAFGKIFGKIELNAKANQANARVVNYDRQDWPLRMLPAMNVYVSDNEEKTSDQGWQTGTVSIVVYWPAKMRRSDLTDVPLAFKGALENFFSSKYITPLLDPHVSLRTEATVPGLNEYGRQLSWSPNTEGSLEKERVPVTILKVRYRIDLRAYYRALNAEGRTKDDPFESTLDKYKGVGGAILGVDDDGTVQVELGLSTVLPTP